VTLLVDALRDRFGDSLSAVVMYGSCLHHGDLSEGLVDFYVLVDSYANAYESRLQRIGNAWLPPNVFYLEVGPAESRLRAKYAVMSVAHFEEACSGWFHPYIWARFAQPSRLVYARDTEVERRVRDCFAHAVVRFLAESVPVCAGEELDAVGLWQAGLQKAYASEIRPEKNRPTKLVDVAGPEFERLTRLAAPRLSPMLEAVGPDRYRSLATPRARRKTLRRWRIRRWQGRVLSVLRLMKAAFTFEGGADYLAWKVERHTGVAIEVTPELRRRPIRHGLVILWHLLRQGVVR
jgi:hypothetical protein